MRIHLPFFLANRFVAAESLAATLPEVRRLNAQGMHVALDLLGEYVVDRSVAAAGRDAYIELVRTLARERAARGLDGSISIKLSMMGQKIDEAFCLENLRRLLRVAREHDVFVRLDMEGSDVTASTLDLFETVFPDFPDHVGIVLQAYLKRTSYDVERMCELGASVRLCKGAYKEPPALAYQRMDAIRARFEDYMRRLLVDGRYPGIATHDDRLIDATKAFAREQGVAPERFEFQMLYGVRPDTQRRLVEEGYNVLVYVPYGTEWLPYFSRRLAERKENVFFVLRNLFRA